MVESHMVSEIKRDYITQLAKAEKRYDGRGWDEYRSIRIETGLVKQAEGSARVHIGDTEVVVGVKCEIGTPYPDSPNSGVMSTAAELIPMASPDFESGPPRQPSIELARVVDRGIRETETIDFDKLCIEPGEKVWMVFIDSHILDYDGNLIDACSLGAMAALMTAKVPNMKKGLNIPDVPLPINHWPITCTAMKIGDRLAFDPSLIEDQVGGPRLSVSTDENGDIRAMQKGEEGGLTKDEVKHIIATARVKGNEIRTMLQDHVKGR